jgi:hypothetical protein
MRLECLSINFKLALSNNSLVRFYLLDTIYRNYLFNLRYRVYNTLVHPINLTFFPFYKNIKKNVFSRTDSLNVYQLITENGVCFKKATATVNVTVAVWGEYLIV